MEEEVSHSSSCMIGIQEGKNKGQIISKEIMAEKD
jgi:hypothetical protein